MASWIVFAALALSSVACVQSCPITCIICFMVSYICNTDDPVQDVSHLIIPAINVGAFQNGGFITSLDMSTTSLSTLFPNSFQGLDSIQKLNLSHNNIASLPNGLFQSLDTLTVLDLSWNQISSLSVEAFQGLTNLTHLYVHHNLVETIAVEELLVEMPSLQIITLSGNIWNCDCNISGLHSLLASSPPGVQVQDRTNVLCSSPSELVNAPVQYLSFASDTGCPFTVVFPSSSSPAFTPSASSSPMLSSTMALSGLSASSSLFPAPVTSYTIALTSLTPLPTPSPSIMSSTLFNVASSSLPLISPSPTLLPPSCMAELTESAAGQIQWPVTATGSNASVACPLGPSGSYANRQCVRSEKEGEVVWGVVDEGSCLSASQILQELSAIGPTDDLEDVSAQLTTLPFSALSTDDLSLFIDVATHLAAEAGNDSQVVKNVLFAVDSALTSDSVQLLISSPEQANELQQLVSTALLETVDADDPELVLEFENLLVASKYFANGTEKVTVGVVEDGKGVEFDNISQADIIVQYSSDESVYVVQVTVYNNNDLFQENCPDADSKKDCEEQVITPITVVTTTGDENGSQVEVTYEDVEGSMFECAVWNTTTSEWISGDCTTSGNGGNSVTCNCLGIGPIAVIQVPSNETIIPSMNATEPSQTPVSFVTITFYVLCGISLLLHLPVIIASCVVCLRYDFVRNIQALINHAIAQALVFLVMGLSWEQWTPESACLCLGTLLHYFIFCSFLWLVFHPVILAMGEVQRKLYEQRFFILPFMLTAWGVPMLPVVVYGAFTYPDLQTNVTGCWLETLEFPNYFTYLSICLAAVTILEAMVCIVFLACSSYVISSSTFLQLANIPVEVTLFSTAVGMQFVTGIDPIESNLFITGGLVLVCGSYFFVVNVLARPKTRWMLFCHSDPAHKQFKQKLAKSSASDSMASHLSQRPLHRRAPSRCNQEMNLDYINDYFGYPLDIIGQLGEGKRIRGHGSRPTSCHQNQSDSSFA